MKTPTKYLKFYGFIAAVLLVHASCSKVLDVKTPSIVTDEYYNTKEGQQKLIVDLYSKYRNVFNTGELQYYGTDLYMAVSESITEKMFNGYDASFNSTAPVVDGYWGNLYKIVAESNILISKLNQSTAGSDYDAMLAKGKFFRALAYYYLVETFGDVPFYTKPEDEVITAANRTPESDIYSFLIKDLESAKGKLQFGNNQVGEVNDAAVRFLLGKLYLTRAYRTYKQTNDFQLAATNFDAIIQSPQYRLLSTYASVYDENNQNNAEVIWAIQYGLNRNFQGGGNPQQSQFGFNITALEPEMFTRVQADYSAANRQYWVIPKVHEYFTNPDKDTRYDATFKRLYNINNPTNANLGMPGLYFPRWNDNSGNTVGANKYYPFKVGNDYNWYPQSTAIGILNNASDRMPMIQKFKDTKMVWGGAGTREDVIFRLSDAYLLAAEAYLGANNSATAVQYVNIIRKRAAADETTFNNMFKISSVDIDYILDERARELLGDHDRWFDLKRTNKLIERAKANNPFVQKYNNLSEMHLLRPIPQDEINKTKGLKQNKGYN